MGRRAKEREGFPERVGYSVPSLLPVVRCVGGWCLLVLGLVCVFSSERKRKGERRENLRFTGDSLKRLRGHCFPEAV